MGVNKLIKLSLYFNSRLLAQENHNINLKDKFLNSCFYVSNYSYVVELLSGLRSEFALITSAYCVWSCQRLHPSKFAYTRLQGCKFAYTLDKRFKLCFDSTQSAICKSRYEVWIEVNVFSNTALLFRWGKSRWEWGMYMERRGRA